MSNHNQAWRITSVDLHKKLIPINKNHYVFGKHQLGSGAFGRVYPAQRQKDGLSYSNTSLNLHFLFFF